MHTFWDSPEVTDEGSLGYGRIRAAQATHTVVYRNTFEERKE